MNRFAWTFGKAPAAPDAPHALLADIAKQGRQYLDEADNGKWVYPACKRTSTDVGADRDQIGNHTRLEAMRYLLMVPRGEFSLLSEPQSQAAILEAYLRQLPHDETVIEFTGNTMNDLAISVIAGFNWLTHCAGLADADRKSFSGTLNHFRRIAMAAEKWWAMEGASERYAQLIQAGQEPPLFLYLVWADYGRLANEIAAACAGRRA
jgi:hypothetical protein